MEFIPYGIDCAPADPAQGKNGRDRLFLLELVSYILQQIPDLQILGADILAETALQAIGGAGGFLDGDGHQFTVTEFGTMKKHVWNKKISEIPEYKDAGHGGGDHGLFRDFLEAVCWNDVKRLTSSVDVSVESHVMGFDAEKSRKNGKKMKVKV